MKTIIVVSLIMLMLASGFILISNDRSDDGVKLLSDDDYKDIDMEIKFEDGDNVYSSGESMTLDTKDYEKTFIASVS